MGAAPLLGENELEDAQVFSVAKAVEEAGNAAILACSAGADFLAQKKPVLDEAEHLQAETNQLIAAVQPRIKHAMRQAAEALRQAKQNKDRIVKKLAASRRLQRRQSIFKKYDKDGDGHLNRQEVIDYALGEFNFEIPQESLDRICR